MNTTYKNWLVAKDDSHIVTLTLDQPDASVNVLSREILIELQIILDEIKKTSLKALVFRSKKINCFIAGADVNEFSDSDQSRKLDAYEKALQSIQTGQHVMNTIENLPFPTFALINGHCLGGGMELALACEYRFALDNIHTRLGLPEVKLGIHPGFGGTVRSNRLLGVFKAMELMLSGRTLSVKQAKSMGLIDDVVPERHFDSIVEQCLANKAMLRSINKKHQRPFYFSLLEADFIRSIIAYLLKKNVSKKVQKKHYPAPFELIKLWHLYADNDDIMMKKEAESVAHLIISESAQNLIRVFHLQNKLKARPQHEHSKTSLEHIHIIGGGVMGGDIAIWCVYKGFTVTVHDRSHEVLARLIQRGNHFFSNKLKEKHLFQSAMDRLIPDINNLGLKKADLVIEAIIENVSAKQQVFIEAEKNSRTDCIFATNTSSIPLGDISKVLQMPSRLVGIHFFNPVAKMPLIEIISSPETSQLSRQIAADFARCIGKLPLHVTSTPGFLVNRVLMPYLLEAIELYSEGIPANTIDKAAKDFGMPMGPIELADKVGLDICLSVADNLSQSQKVSVPKILKKLVNDGHLGIKSNQGFYHYKKGRAIKTKAIKTKESYQGLTQKQISNRLMFRLFNEAIACLDEKVVTDSDHLDAGIVFGTGFAPFLGGPIHYIKHQGVQEMDHKLIDLSNDYGKRFKPVTGWNILASKL